MNMTTPEVPTSKKKAPRKKPVPFLTIDHHNLVGWIMSCFVICGCMFFLGVMVGRNTAPVQFDVEEIEEKLSKLQGISVLNQENAEKPPAPEATVADITNIEENIREMSELPIIREDIIDILKEKGQEPEIYEQYVPPVLTPKYAKTAPEKPKQTAAKAAPSSPSTADAPPTDILKVDVLKPEIQASSAQAPAPAVTPADTPATPPAPRQSSPAVSGVAFAIQIASLKDPEKARSLMNKFREKGYPAFCQSSEINTTTWHRVRIGPYPDRAMADKDYNRLKAAGVDALIISME